MAVEAEIYSDNLGMMESVWGINNNNGDCFYFNNNNLQEQQYHHHQQQQIPLFLEHNQQQQQGFQFQSLNYTTGTSSSDVAATAMGFTQSLAALLEKERQEFEWLLQIQNERLRTTLQESSGQQLAILSQKYESHVSILMSQKDDDLALAAKKQRILEDCLIKIESEIHQWQIKATESEAQAAEINNALTQLRERNHNHFDAESYCNEYGGDLEQKQENMGMNMACKLCKARRSCIVFLPCRHLCSCKFCEDLLGFCPVCESVKEASLEVFLD